MASNGSAAASDRDRREPTAHTQGSLSIAWCRVCCACNRTPGKGVARQPPCSPALACCGRPMQVL